MTLHLTFPPSRQRSGRLEHPKDFLVRGRLHRARLRKRVNEYWDMMFPGRVPLQTGEEQRR